MAQASLLACEGLSGVCLVPTVASKKMMPKAGKQDGNRERGSSPDLLSLRQDPDKPRARKDDDTPEASNPKKSMKKRRKRVPSAEGPPSSSRRSQSQMVVIEQNGSFQLKNFICDHCFGAFRSSYHLKRHILIHTGEKPFECDLCSLPPRSQPPLNPTTSPLLLHSHTP
ncbi:zinc finger protein 740 isoform X2 [Manacus candei]|uniref:zinc finger protein 740 isoform X2 n=1 Tax=Manacus candei TaxID=415023 RepID=UPI000FE228E0|nr:zinc finger protein 740 isoform X2 [Manacus candei]